MQAEVGIIGAGPIGLELAIALKEANISALQFEKAQAGQAIFDFPVGTRFFSSSERIGIANVPVQTLDQQKCSREEYLDYLRSVILHFGLIINSYEEVLKIERKENLFVIETSANKKYEVRYLVLATGGTSYPRRLQVIGEDLKHVSSKLEDPHKYFQKKVLIVGGKNSAVEAALRCFHAKADVTIILRKEKFEQREIKYWLLPELLSRIDHKEIHCFYQTEVVEIMPGRVLVKDNAQSFEIPADFVIKALGFEADMHLFNQIGAPFSDEGTPIFNHETMETPIPNLYVCGTVIGGTQRRYKVFIENTHEHVGKILSSVAEKLGVKVAKRKYAKTSQARLEE